MPYLSSQLTQIGNRLNRYLLFKKISIDTLAREAAISSTLISNILNGGSCDFIFFLKIVNLLPDLNTHWIFTGQGDMLLPAAGASSPGTQGKRPAPAPSLPPPAAQAEITALRKQLEEKNAVIRRLKETLSPVQNILMEMD